MTLGEFSSILSLRFYHTGLLCVAVGGGGRFCIAGVPVVKYALLWSPLSVPKGRIRAQWGERATALSQDLHLCRRVVALGPRSPNLHDRRGWRRCCRGGCWRLDVAIEDGCCMASVDGQRWPTTSRPECSSAARLLPGAPGAMHRSRPLCVTT